MLKLLWAATAVILVISNVISNDINDLTLDVAVKLKKEFSDEIVSDLFATSHDLTKLAKLVELDEDGLYHFRIKNPYFDEEDMHPTQIGHDQKHHRAKRHIEDRIEKLRNDDRVIYVEPQEYLIRQKRLYLDDEELEELIKISPNWLAEMEEIERIKDAMELIQNSHSTENIQELFKKHENINKGKLNQLLNELTKESGNLGEVHFKNLPKEIDFDDAEYGKQWYLINEGQLKIPAKHDLNVMSAWLNGYSGKNVSIVIIDDGLDHEHPDFEGKYVSLNEE